MTMDEKAKELMWVAGAGKSRAGSSIGLLYPENPLGQMLDAEQAH